MPAIPTYPPAAARIRDVYLPGDGPRPRPRRSKPDSQQAPKPHRHVTAPPPLTADQAEWIRAHAHRPQHGRRPMQPRRIGQASCLHLATPECDQCRAGYHETCMGVSWPRLEETWIADSRGSSLYWAPGSHYRVWTPPRECECACRTAPAPAPQEPRRAPDPPLPVTAPAATPAAPAMPGGWEQPALPL